MSSLNPFLEDEYHVTNVADSELATAVNIKTKSKELSLDNLAEELIKNKFILTALELYTEIQERGKDLLRLKNYFSNPSNFDLPVGYSDVARRGSLCMLLT